jgi:hypothetical protein
MAFLLSRIGLVRPRSEMITNQIKSIKKKSGRMKYEAIKKNGGYWSAWEHLGVRAPLH